MPYCCLPTTIVAILTVNGQTPFRKPAKKKKRRCRVRAGWIRDSVIYHFFLWFELPFGQMLTYYVMAQTGQFYELFAPNTLKFLV